MGTSVDDLIAYHDIGRVKYRYLRALDTHDWGLMRTCFSEDARAWYSGGKYATEGREAIVSLLESLVPANSFVGSHVAIHPELELTGPASAAGVWRMQDIVHFLDDHTSYENLEIKAAKKWWAPATTMTAMSRLAGNG